VLAAGGRIQLADVTIQNPVSAEGAGTSTSRPVELPGRCWRSVRQAPRASRVRAQLVDTYARSNFEDTRRKAQKFGARGTTVRWLARHACVARCVTTTRGRHVTCVSAAEATATAARAP
jgi:hypothetical protein